MNQIFVKLTLSFWVLLSACLVSTKISAQPGGPSFMRGRATMEMSLPVHRTLKSIAYGNGIFVAVGPAMTILTSKDGKNWVNHSSEITNLTVNINFTSQTYAANGDAITVISFGNMPQWLSFPEDKTNRANLDDAELAALIDSRKQKIQDYRSKFPTTPFRLCAVTFGGGMFVIVGDCGEILASHDGEHWAAPVSGSSNILTSVTWGDSGFVVVGDKGTILTSPDGSIWTKSNSGTDQTLFGVAYGNGTFVALGDNSTILVSSDGIKWTPTDIGPEGMESIAFGNGIFMGTSIDTDFPGKKYLDNHHTMGSKDGKNWYEVKHPYPPQEGQVGAMTFDGHSGGTTSLSFGGGLFIATSVEGIYTSKDGSSWNTSVEPDGYKSCYYGASFGNGVFAAVENGSTIGPNHMGRTWGMTIATSKEAGSWELSQTPPSRLLWGSIENDKSFRVVGPLLGPFGIQLMSTAGGTWTTPDKISISGSVWGNGFVFSSGKQPIVLSSKDGIVWTRLLPKNSDQPTPLTIASNAPENGVLIDLNGQCYKLNLAASVGQFYEIQASTNLQDWTTLTTITNTGGILNFVDRDITNYPMRFYRLKLQ
jgi:hypothetical protein